MKTFIEGSSFKDSVLSKELTSLIGVISLLNRAMSVPRTMKGKEQKMVLNELQDRAKLKSSGNKIKL